MTPDQAIKIVAQDAIHRALTEYGTRVEWENYPEIGEDDWESVLVWIELFSTPPSADDFTAAYALLEARADT